MIDFLVFLVASLLIILLVRLPSPNRNRLAIGQTAGMVKVDIEIQPPIELDWKTKAEILQARQDAVMQHPALLTNAYAPSEEVFGQIVDGLPWWGIYGQFFYGSGEQSIAGVSEETRFILNPYLMVAAEFYPWWSGRIAEQQLETYQLICNPEELIWYPQNRKAEVTYNALCIQKGQAFSFGLIAYNARDLNLNSIYVYYLDSLNITKSDAPTIPIKIPQYIHQGNSCGYPGGCNNMSPYTPELDELHILDFPAHLVVWLWNSVNASLQQDPDMIWTIHFR